MSLQSASELFLRAILKNEVSRTMMRQYGRAYDAEAHSDSKRALASLRSSVEGAVANGFDELKAARPDIAEKADVKWVEGEIVRLILSGF